MGETILANRFVNGLLLSLKVKVVGSEGTMDQLFLKAGFEESKSGELRSGLSLSGGHHRGDRTPARTHAQQPLHHRLANTPEGMVSPKQMEKRGGSVLTVGWGIT